MAESRRGRPPSAEAEERALAQRARILDAAQRCFIEQGFHAAGMARIAHQAGMSPGLIYRYFPGKAAIIRAIVERQLELVREDVRLHRRVDLLREVVDNYGRSRIEDQRRLNPALLLELSAESTRDPELRAIVREFDAQLREALIVWVTQGIDHASPGAPPEEAATRVLMLQIMFEGLKVRETREPDLDRRMLEEALGRFLRLILPAHAEPRHGQVQRAERP